MDYQRLFEIAKQILVLRGSAGSGNYAHTGRAGKLGGSSKGGGLRRIGAKKDTPAGDRKKAAKKFREGQGAEKKDPKKPIRPTGKIPKFDKSAVGDVRNPTTTNDQTVSKDFENWHKSMPEAQRNALQTYTSSGYLRINGSLRGVIKAKDADKENIANIDKALKKSPLKEDTVVFRNMDEDALKDLLGSDQKRWTGQAYSDKGYTSTSIKPRGGFEGIPMEIRVPKGTPAGYLGNLPGGSFTSEQEMLLGRGLKFRILKVKDGRKPTIISEVINE